MILLDGGLGHELVKRHGKPAHPLWSVKSMLENPAAVEQLHRDFVRAGADVITLNTYAATPARIQRDGRTEWLQKAHRLAGEAALSAKSDGILVLGCLPPLIASYRADLAPSFDDALAQYRQLVALQSDFVDGFICETLPTQAEAKAALTAAKEAERFVWVGLVPAEGHANRLRGGEPLDRVSERLINDGCDAILLNCASHETITASLPSIAQSRVPFGGYPNAFVSVDALQPGGTVDVLRERDDVTPELFAQVVQNWIGSGASIIGGCCGIGVEHINAARQCLPRD